MSNSGNEKEGKELEEELSFDHPFEKESIPYLQKGDTLKSVLKSVENIFKEAVDKFGVENQLLKLVEEMAELTQAIIKHRLYPDEPKHFNTSILS